MDNAQKAIMIGVGLFITIIIIAAVMTITGMGTNLFNQSKTKLTNISASLQQQLTSDYDNVKMTGADVLAAINTYYQDKNVVVYLKPATGSTIPVCTSAKSLKAEPIWGSFSGKDVKLDANVDAVLQNNAAQPSYGEFSTVDNANYVNSISNYQAKLIKTNDGVVVGIVFYKL